LVLAGDIGGTNARLALIDADAREPAVIEVYPSPEYAGLPEIVAEFLAEHPERPSSATFGVAGPVRDGTTTAVNLAWPVDARELAEALDIERVAVINDLEANAWGLGALGQDDLDRLNDAEPQEGGTQALISAGTGLGEAFVTHGPRGPLVQASEGGHVDFAARTKLEDELRHSLAADDEHVSYEDVCSGGGLVDIYAFLRARSPDPEPQWLAAARGSGDEAEAISKAGLEHRDPVADQALDLMVSIYGAQAGNLALTVLATGGVYLGGGIAPQIIERLREGFMESFLDKGRMSELVGRIPVYVILNDRTALLGAARHAAVAAEPPAGEGV
jgi:glucokinase